MGATLDALIGLRLSIVRRAADMLVLHFGEIRPHKSGKGTVGDYALHVQCPWRFDGPARTVTGSDDLWDYAGPGERPPNWSYEDGQGLQDRQFSRVFARDETTRSWVNETERFFVTGVEQTKRGDVRIDLSGQYAILVFPANSRREAWRFFATSDDGDHLIFPPKWEAWMRVVEQPKSGDVLQAPPVLVLEPGGTDYRCGRCGRILITAEFGTLKGAIVHCRNCDHYNEVTL